MARRGSRILAVAVAVGAFGACTDLSGFATGGPENPDAGDASEEAATIDDAGSEAAIDAGIPFCMRATHAFCDDFDRPGPATEGWSAPFIDPPATLDLTTNRSHSPPSSLLVTQPALDAGGSPKYVYLERRFNSPWKRIVVEFDMHVAAPTWTLQDANACIFQIEFAANATETQTVRLTLGRTYLDLAAFNQPGASGRALSLDRWIHVKVDADPASNVAATVGDEVYNIAIPAGIVGSSPRMTVFVGVLGFASPTPALDIHYDNVAVDLP